MAVGLFSVSSAADFIANLSSSVATYLGIPAHTVVSFLALTLVALAALGAVVLIRYLGYTPDEAAKLGKTILLIAAYSLCSSTLLIINKVAVTYIPAASSILLCQLATSALFVKGAGVAGAVDVEGLEWEKAKKFMILVIGFVAILFTNVKALELNPVDTIICFRASQPIIIAVIEWLYLGRELPTARSWISLGGVLTGVILYVRHDIHFAWLAYFWLGMWYMFAVFEMVFVKHVCDTVKMNTWTRTYYQNILSVPPMFLLMILDGDFAVLAQPLPTFGVVALVLSCVVGLGMSYFSFALRAAISATSFSVIGNICKILTIFVNMVIWDRHSGAMGTVALFLCLLMGSFYQQAPLRVISGDKTRKDKEAVSGKPVSPVSV